MNPHQNHFRLTDPLRSFLYSKNMSKRVLTAEQVAKILQIHHLTVLKLIKQKKLKAAKVGRVYRIRESAIDDFLDKYST